MKKLLFYLLSSFLFVALFSFCNKKNQQPADSMNDKYAAEWKIIDSLERQGLPQSALEKVDDLYQKVRTQNNQPQLAKCLMYKGKYMVQLEEDGFVKALGWLESEERKAKMPVKALLKSMLGEQYASYLNRNYYRINRRTETPDFKTDDIRTWTIGQLSEKSQAFFLASINDPSLKKVNIKDWQLILTEEKDTDQLRPTLYDFLAHRALDFLRNERGFLTEPAYKFYIEQTEAFAPAAAFSKYNFTAQDSSSTKFQTIKLFQAVISHHLEDNRLDALIDVDLKRLRFVRENGVMENKEELYLTALENLEKRYATSAASTEVLYWIARYYHDQGNRYQPNPTDQGKFDWKKAYEICEKAQRRAPDTYGARMCGVLQSQMLQKNLGVEMEQVNLPDRPLLASVRYRNVKKIFAKVVRLSEKDRRSLQDKRVGIETAQVLNTLPQVKEWTLDLPQVGDYREHRVEMKVEGLPIGMYALLISDNNKFTNEKSAVAYLFTHVSNISYLTRRNKKGLTEFFVVNRESGEPLENAKGSFYVREYNSSTRKYDYLSRGEGYTDQDGYLQPGIGNGNNFQVRWKLGDDMLNLDDYYSNYSSGREPSPFSQTNFFLDRAIYRPGQTIYFKGVVLNFDKDRIPTVAANQKVVVTFKDVNHQEIENKTFTTNEFGTFNGSFRAPKGGLLGGMQIYSSISGAKYFRVEEYKRPKFEVNFEPVKVSYKIGDEVTVTGHAKAFAGNNVDGAKVRYRVVRATRYPYWRGWGWYPPTESMEITNGEATTDAEGKFKISFTAIPDKSAAAKDKPQFDYSVYADVIDITGETRSGETYVKVGYIALAVNIEIPNQMGLSDFSDKAFEISSNNLNGEFANAQGNITVHQLKSPNKIFRNKYWNKPDQFVMTKAEFDRDFPHDIYHEENLLPNWEVGEEVMKTRFDVSRNAQMVIGNASYEVGSYVLTLNTQDRYGERIELKKYFTIYDVKGKKIPSEIKIMASNEKAKYEPGEVAQYFLASAYTDLKVLHEVEFDNEIIDRKWLNISKLENFRKRIEEKHRGNLGYHFSFVKNNRDYYRTETVQVPWTNKDLQFEYSTFRDKLKPGQEEEWRIRISGSKKEKVVSEMLASMYDASLDEFAPNNWGMNVYPTNYVGKSLRSNNFTITRSSLAAKDWQVRAKGTNRYYRELNWFGFGQYGSYAYGIMSKAARATASFGNAPLTLSAPEMMQDETSTGGTVTSDQIRNLPNRESKNYKDVGSNEKFEEDKVEADLSNIKVRTNLDETVFFLPELMTDKNGDVIVKFTMNEALTQWKFLGMALTKDLRFGFTQKEIITQKELMVMPNAPRFMREGDKIQYSAKVSNLTEKELSGTAKLELFDALTNEPINLFANKKSTTLPFKVGAGQSAPLYWDLKIPLGEVMAITHRVVAQAGDFSDGEESSLPVITNRMLVTETMPLPVRGNSVKTFTFERLKNATSSTLQHHEMTLEFTSNPAWYAVQALPYLMEYPYQCTEQIFNRYYANSLATNVANSHPKVKRIFDQWKNTDAMLSNLSKNQELKSALLEETPWVLAAQSEEQQKKNIGLLFDLNRMSQEQADAILKISERQLNNGGFSWFSGGRDSWYITQYIVEGMGHLNALGINNLQSDPKITQMLNRAIQFIDARILDQYNELLSRVAEGKAKLTDDNLNSLAIHYLYARSFFRGQSVAAPTQKAKEYYEGQAEKYWLNQGMYEQGMIALAFHRAGKRTFTANMIKSFKERALQNDEMGMYWKYDRGYFWYQLPIETHALMIEVFDEVANDAQAVDDLKVWLLKNKQTTHWKTTKATAAAVYALLKRGANWLLEDQPLQITLGNQKIDQSTLDTEAGTGYFKTKWSGEAINTAMAEVKVENPNAVVAWGGLYWQYFEDLDKITQFEDTPLKLNKKLFKMENSDRGPVMTELRAGAALNPGDKVQVRIELRVDRPMEYIHMKDMRASGFEPLNVLSQYKWQGGLGYYESTKDASTNFFITYLPKGTFVFEYPLVVNHRGNFSNGITTIQSMYAPEFTSHSEGIRVEVK
ncbi:MAG: alpha-2-macroglobulin family protein [Bacteroidota bacterium]